jgi:hypothetical protein
MSTLATPGLPSFTDPRAVLRRAWSINPPLTVAGVAMLLTLAVAIVGLIVDPRVITGAPAWLKPAKFAISIAIYSFTLLWLLTFVQGHRRLVALVSWGIAVALLFEEVLIVGQVLRGTTSHFNVSTPFDAAVWTAMAAAVVVIWLLTFLAGVLLLFQRLPSPAFAWSLRLGLLVALVGMAIAVFMAQPTPQQEAAVDAGRAMPIAGAHSVGVADGGPGLPVVGWSTEGGDLRVPHFVGLHALQILPLTGWLLTVAGGAWLGMRHRVSLVWIVGLAYLGLVLLLTWQALRGQSVIAPDAVTLTGLATGAAAVGLAVLGVVFHSRFTAQAAEIGRGRVAG